MTNMSEPDSGQAPGSVDPSSTDSLPGISRRSFAGKAAAMAATPFLFVSELLGANCSPERAMAGQSQQQTTFDLTADQVREADARLANAVRQFGDRLSEEQRGRLRRILLYNQKMLASIRAFDIENGDAPASVLRYYDVGTDAPERPRLHPSPKPSPGIEKQG